MKITVTSQVNSIPSCILLIAHLSMCKPYNRNGNRKFEISDSLKTKTSVPQILCANENSLETGVCTVQGYKTHTLPNHNLTTFVLLLNQNVHTINCKTNTLSMDIELVLYWNDPGIKTFFSDEDMRQGYIPLSTKAIQKIWTPEIYIAGLSDYKSFADSQHISSAKIIYDSRFFVNASSVVEYKISFEASVYCSFNFANYPNDTSVCSFIFGSQFSNIRYIFLNKTVRYAQCNTGQHDCRISLIKGNVLEDGIFRNRIGLELRIHRILRPFIYRYYLPCICSVMISSLSMTFPIYALPARVGISATILLATLNLYVQQMVSKIILDYHPVVRSRDYK